MSQPSAGAVAKAEEVDLQWRGENGWPGMIWDDGSRPHQWPGALEDRIRRIALALDAFAREREAAVWEEAAKRFGQCAEMARQAAEECGSSGYWAREGAYRAYKHVEAACREESAHAAEARRTG